MVIAWPKLDSNPLQMIQLNVISAPSGSIHSPNYPNPYDSNDDCAWILEVDPNHRIEFTFIDFDVEPHSNCSYDYVALYDGPTEQDPLILLHCGQNVPTPNTLYSTSNKMYVRMKADGSITSKGFLANFTRACGATIPTSGDGELASPNYPHPWESGGECSWTIIGNTLSKIHVHQFFLELIDYWNFQLIE